MATVTKRGNTYLIRASGGVDVNGNYIRKSKTWKPPAGLSAREIKKELELQKALFEQEVQAGEIFDQNVTLEEFAERWLRDYCQPQLKATTYQNYKSMLYDRILPVLGNMKLCKIQPQHLIAFYNSLRAPGSRRKSYYQADPSLKKYLRAHKITQETLSKKAGVSFNTVRNALRCKNIYGASMEAIMKALELPPERFFHRADEPTAVSGSTALYYHHLLQSLFTTAVQWQIIQSNPCSRVKPPRRNRAEAIWLDDAEAIQLLECLNSAEPVYKTLFTLYIFTGMRRGEALGLKWTDINFQKQLIDINKELVYVHKVGVKLDTPKNDSSRRVIKVPRPVIDLLEDWKEKQAQNKATYGDMYEDSDFIFTNKVGRYLHPDTVSSWFSRFVKAHDLPPIHLHSLRHTNASIMIAKGVDLKTVSKRLGHADLQTTIMIYTHQIKTADEAASQMLDDLFYGKKNED